LSGEPEAVKAAIVISKSFRIRTKVLPVSAPFHCSLMSTAAQALQSELAKSHINFKKPIIPIISNVTGEQVNSS
jgi:[acyl-carrier-protein] S-malonyltransferase